MVDGVRDGTGIYTGFRLDSVMFVGVPLGLEGSLDSPGQLLMGSWAVPGFTPGWLGVGWIGGHSPCTEGVVGTLHGPSEGL